MEELRKNRDCLTCGFDPGEYRRVSSSLRMALACRLVHGNEVSESLEEMPLCRMPTADLNFLARSSTTWLGLFKLQCNPFNDADAETQT